MASIQSITAKYKAELLHNDQHAVHILNNAYLTALDKIQPSIDHLTKEIQAAKDAGQTINPSWIREKNRLSSIQHIVETEMQQYGHVGQAVTTQLQHQSVQLGENVGMAQLDATIPPGVTYRFGVPSTKAINSFIGSTQNGSPLDTLFESFGTDASEQVREALVLGLTLGWNPNKTAKQVQGALDVSRQRAITIARTEQLRAYRSANLETFKANDDVIDSWIWTADLTDRTCIACILMNGTEHDLDEDFASHVCCRCVPMPKTKSWSDILAGTGIDTSDLDENDDNDVQSGEDWFNDQDDATQRSILGAAKYNALQAGDVSSVTDFLGVKDSHEWGQSVYVKPLKELVS